MAWFGNRRYVVPQQNPDLLNSSLATQPGISPQHMDLHCVTHTVNKGRQMQLDFWERLKENKRRRKKKREKKKKNRKKKKKK